MYDFNLIDGLYAIDKKKRKKKKIVGMSIPFVIVFIFVFITNIYFYHYGKMYEKDQVQIEGLIDKYSTVDQVKQEADKLEVKKMGYQLIKDQIGEMDIHSSDDLISLSRLIADDLYLHSLQYSDAYVINITGQSDSYNSVVNLLYDIRKSFYFDEGEIISLTKGEKDDGNEVYNFNIKIYKLGRLNDELQIQ